MLNTALIPFGSHGRKRSCCETDGRICREAACLPASQSIDHLIVNSILPILAVSTVFFNSLSVYMFFHSLFHLSLMKFLQRLLKFYALASLIAVDVMGKK
ncbi:hypothetical protein T12_16415 [Trichinella patagoniensis]|uniref:Uncharacterized protein n=1 Tax=Trichinella patagoniensis TaxID=990121 RepID=A0A0V0ZZJ4_9BILA|nr:hypothetical protein T12_16415 [Trichinella patagoniensis]